MQPTAQGTLAETPLAHVLLTCAKRQMSGTLAIWPDDPTPETGQDRVLMVQGTIRQVLLMDSASDVTRSLLPVFRRSKAAYAFYGADLIAGATGALEGEVDVFTLIAAALRGGSRDDVVDRVLQGYGADSVRVRRGAPLARLQLIPKERAFVDVLQAQPAPVHVVISRFGDQRIARRLLYLLSITDCLEAIPGSARQATPPPAMAGGAGSLPPPPGSDLSSPSNDSGRLSDNSIPPTQDLPGYLDSASMPPIPRALMAPPPPPRAPRNLSDPLKKRWNDIRTVCKKLDETNYFEILGVDQNASTEAVRDAYFAKVKEWHPDRLPHELGELRSHVDRVFKYLTDASNTLQDLDERGPYLKLVQGGGGTPKADREAHAIVGAALDFEKIEVLIRVEKYDQARRMLNRILAISPDNPEYLAAKGELLFLTQPTRVQESLELIDQALKVSPKSVRALLARARIMEKQSKSKMALSFYKKVVAVDESNVEAQRMVRLLGMRLKEDAGKGKEGDAPEKSGGLFGRFFKK